MANVVEIGSNNRICFANPKIPIYQNTMNQNQMFISTLGLWSLYKCGHTRMGIPIINLRRSDDHLRFMMGIPLVPIRRCHPVEWGPRKHTAYPAKWRQFDQAYISFSLTCTDPLNFSSTVSFNNDVSYLYQLSFKLHCFSDIFVTQEAG